MFGLFKRKPSVPPPDKPAVTPDDKKWVEQNLMWFIEIFGLQRILKEPFLLPTFEKFPYKNLQDEKQFRQFFEQVCECWNVDPNEIKVNLFDDIKSKQWNNLVPGGTIHEASGFFHQEYTTDKQRFVVRIARSNLEHYELLTTVLSHELAHVKLLGGNYIKTHERDMEPFTDLANIYFGFGIFVANTCELKNHRWIGRMGYLPNEVISYANALICYISGKDASTYSDYLNSNTRMLFLQDFAYLKHTNDTILTKKELDALDFSYTCGEQVNEAFKNKEYQVVIDVSRKQLLTAVYKSGLHNNIGYAFLLQKKYAEAIEAFTEAIDADPYSDYPINNRGYCRLQLGDLDNAFIDLYSSYEMNPEN